jgi:hypothetical protein
MQKDNKITIDLKEVIDLNINIVYSNGIPALQFRKTVSTCDKNMVNIKSILKRALEADTEIIMPVRLQIVNKPLAIGKLKQAGIKLD